MSQQSPSISSEDISLIRKIENELLDCEYKKYAILHRSNDLALGYLLKIYGDISRDLTNFPNDYTEQMINMIVTLMERGLAHCIRWILRSTSSSDRKVLPSEVPRVNNTALNNEAAEFLTFGREYHTIFMDHVAWSRDAMNVSIDQTSKIVRFSNKPNLDWGFYESQFQASNEEIRRYHEGVPLSNFLEDLKKWMRGFRIIDDRIEMTTDIHSTLSVTKMLTYLEHRIWSNMEPSLNLGGYTLQDFRQFYAGIYVLSHHAISLERIIDSKYGDENFLGSLLMDLTTDEALEHFKLVTGLGAEIVKPIIVDLTFDIESDHALLSNQPFISDGKQHLMYVPRIIVNSHPERMLAGAINKGPKRKIYESIIENMQDKGLDVLESALSGTGLNVIREKLIIVNSRQIRPDLILFKQSQDSLLVIDYKHAISPYGPSEVIYKMNEIRKGIAQIKKYISALRADQTSINLALDRQSECPKRKVYGALIFRAPMPVLMETDPEVLMIDWSTLHKKIQDFNGLSIDRLIQIIQDCSKARATAKISLLENSIRINDWTYVHENFGFSD